jgi:UrcA family protein
MNARTRFPRRSSTTISAAACIIFSAAAPLAAFADPPAPQTPTLQSSVSLSDVDLSTPEGVHAAHKRLKRKAEHLCRQLWDSVSATYRWTYAACVQETLAIAFQALNVPTLANHRPQPKP